MIKTLPHAPGCRIWSSLGDLSTTSSRRRPFALDNEIAQRGPAWFGSKVAEPLVQMTLRSEWSTASQVCGRREGC